MRVKLRKKLKGQSTVEYILVFTAIVALIVWAAFEFFAPTSDMKVIETSMTEAEDAIGRAADAFLEY